MKYFSLFIFMTFMLWNVAALPTAAQAQTYDFEGFNKMSGNAVQSLFSGRTFWGKNQHDRFFFGKDGSFAQQYVKSGQSFKPGATFYGQWNVDNDGAVCFTYQQSNVGKTPANECFDVYMGPDKFKPLPKYTDPLYLVKKGDDSRTTVEYFWSRWMDGRLVFEPTFAAQFEKHLAYMESIKNKFDADKFRSTPPVKDMSELPADAQAYVQAISGKVFFTPYQYLYFGENGDYILFERGDFDANTNDVAELQEKARRGRWIMFKNVHCWSLYGDGQRSSCQMVGRGQSLDQQVDSFVTHMDDGFSRLLNGNPVGIMTVEQTGAPQAFASPAQ